MFQFSKNQFATFVCIPIVTILLVWTSAIFQRNRKRWGPYDIAVISVLISSIIRNLTTLSYVIVLALQHTLLEHHCSILVWLLSSIHTFQASCLTTLAVVALFSIKLQRREQTLRQFLTSTHMVYHIFCLMTLCACVGVAAILAESPQNGVYNNCRFMPFELDAKFNIFVIVLNCFLASVSLVAFILTCFHCLRLKKTKRRDYFNKSTSDLSELSLNNAFDKQYFDTYTIVRNNNYYECKNCNNNNNMCNSDFSTTVSSTNSRKPCITQECEKKIINENQTGLETIMPILIVCYLFLHLPLIIFCIYPKLVSPWPVSGVALWLGLVQDLLIPIGLSLIDSRFCQWVSRVYKCSDRQEKLPHVGINGKFRPFTSPPQSLEPILKHRQEQRFPLTNGSLYTSIDGRLPIIHNYRRPIDSFQKKYTANRPICCNNCVTDLCPSHSNLHHLSPHYVNKKLVQHQQNLSRPIQTSLSQEVVYHDDHRNFLRLCRSEDNVSGKKLAIFPGKIDSSMDYSSSDDGFLDNKHFDTISTESMFSITTEANGDFDFFQNKPKMQNVPRSRSVLEIDQYQFQNEPLENFVSQVQFKPMRSKESLQPIKSNNLKLPQTIRTDFQIKSPIRLRGSLENFQLAPKLHRSNSSIIDDKRTSNRLLRSNSKLSDCTYNVRHKIKSVEYLPNSNTNGIVFLDDVYYKSKRPEFRNYVGSVPDLKKIFISEYI